jgi:hypothetical protein
LGAGIDAKRASLEGRSGGGVGSGTGWRVISARALVAQKAQMRVGESKPPSKSGTSWLKQKEQQGGRSSDMETPKAFDAYVSISAPAINSLSSIEFIDSVRPQGALLYTGKQIQPTFSE